MRAGAHGYRAIDATARHCRILLVDDREASRELIATELEEAHFEVVQATNGEEGWERFLEYEFDLVVTDLRMPRVDGMALLRRLGSAQSPRPRIPVLVLSAYGTLSVAAEAGRAGAVDFLRFSEASVEEIVERVERILRTTRIDPPLALLGSSAAARELRDRVDAVAPLHSTILITGPKGCGRRSVGRYIHHKSPFAHSAFLATTAQGGLHDLAKLREGTCYIEDAHELAASDQIRFRDELSRLESLGSSAQIRLIISLSDDPFSLSTEGTLDEELAARLARLRIDLRPLSIRSDDFLVLVTELSTQIARRLGRGTNSISDAAIDELSAHPWHDDLQGLEAVVETVIACSIDGHITAEQVRAALSNTDAPLVRIRRERDRDERKILIELYRRHGTFSGVARELGITRNAAKYRLARHNLLPSKSRSASDPAADDRPD